jgi:RNA polymerase sigma-70 factor (ECF subfamily)
LTILKNEQDAEDVTQDVFLRVFRQINRFQYQAAFSTWLTAIVVNTCRDRLRRQKVRRVLSLDWLHPQPASREPTVAEGFEQEHKHTALWDCIDRMDDRYRLPMILFYRDGLCAKEIAMALNLPVKTVYSRLNTARELLQKQMREQAKCALPKVEV